MAIQLTPSTLSLKEALEYYENGKHRRYTLLFAVNGGAFAVAKLFFPESGKSAVVLGNLTLQHISVGMALFTAIMVWDIYSFGQIVKTTYLQSVFNKEGKIVLLLLGTLQIVGWFFVSGIRLACF